MKKSKSLLITIILMLIVISVGTYAWLSYRSNNTAMVLTIGEVGSMNITLKPYKFNSSIDPTITYEGNDYVQVTASNETNDAVYDIGLYYKINDIPEELIDETFKYTILRSTDGSSYVEYDEGNFSSAESGSEYVILDNETLESNTEYYYRVYLWIEGSVNDNTDMQGKVFDAELRANYEKTSGIETVTYIELASNYSCDNVSVGDIPLFTYTGDCEVVDDGDGNWKVRFLTDGNLIFNDDILIDAFLVGGGGGGATANGYSGGGGGGGGYTETTLVNLKNGVFYQIVIGAGGTSDVNGEDTSGFGTIAEGGGAGSNIGTGGSGGSGGGGGGATANGYIGAGGGGDGYTQTATVTIENDVSYDIIVGEGGSSDSDGNFSSAFDILVDGGSAGNNGGNGGSGGGGSVSSYNNADGNDGGTNGGNGNGATGGIGQGRTTCEFDEDGCSLDLLYSGGGGSGSAMYGIPGNGGDRGGGNGGYYATRGSSGAVNTGGGGGGGNHTYTPGGSGGSGIVIIRNAR